MRVGAPPVIEDPERPAMTADVAAVAAGGPVMPLFPATGPVDAPGHPSGAPGAPMEPAPPATAGGRVEQEAKPAADADGDGYVRLALRLDDGRLELLGARAVAGPLLRPEWLHAGLVWELQLDGRSVATDTVLDAGTSRAFPAPDADDPERRVHRTVELPAADFHARVARAELPLAALPSATVVVYRAKAGPPEAPLDADDPAPLADRFPRELREIARLEGVRLWELPGPVQEELRAALA
jgi:hypothetical protein